MGYRSNVVIAIRIEIIAEDVIKPIIPKALKELGYTRVGDVVYFSIKDWKWYDSYSDINEIEVFFQILEDRYPKIVDGETLPWFGALRLGEDSTDIQTWGSPYDFDIYVRQYIDSPIYS